jgi:DNA-binding transcriptional MerR regulator
MPIGPRLRIGELSRRVGVSPELLRAWETRYGLLSPERTEGGLRLFSARDERRVRLMVENIAAGLSAAEAARLAVHDSERGSGGDSGSLRDIASVLERTLQELDEPAAQTVLDQLFGDFDLRVALGEVILPFLSRLGEDWASGRRSVADEHFASNVIGGRLRALTRGWGRGAGARALLACPAGERHDLGLLCFGLALRQDGWRITYLGAETPVEDIVDALGDLQPELVVLSAVTPQPFLDAGEAILALGRRVRVGIGGQGATASIAEELNVELLGGDAVGEATRISD